ncbi:hypothetical protein DID76_01135 [Candidatus Marinamargulisbacteria bacterium SCGC AG-414-C22]|nr:hypothetical protein DID76_01135 [Candidatus Marinamargulisbacteria bacterium SCGC AG-414-C22]
MTLQHITKKVIQVIFLSVLIALLAPFGVDYFSNDQDGVNKESFELASTISKESSQKIYTTLKQHGLILFDGTINIHSDLSIVNLKKILSFKNKEIYSHIHKVLEFELKKHERKNRQIEILDSSIIGYNEGQLMWRFFAKYIYAGRSQYLFNAEELYNGYIYNEAGDLIIEDIKAGKVRINTRRKTLSASDSIEAKFIKRAQRNQYPNNSIMANKDGQKSVLISSDELQFYGDKDKVLLSKNVKIVQDDVIIHPNDAVTVDNTTNQAYIDDRFTMKADTFTVSGNKMVIFIDEDRSEMEGDIHIVWQEKNTELAVDEREKTLRSEQTILNSDFATYEEIDDNHILTVSRNIRVVQNDKIISGEYGVYKEDQDLFEISKNVHIQMNSLEWVLSDDTKKNLDNKSINNTIKQKTDITADQLIFTGDKKVLSLTGSVVINQEDKVIKADKVSMNDNDSIILCEGNVSMKKTNNDKIIANFLEINLIDETFIAKDRVESLYHY